MAKALTTRWTSEHAGALPSEPLDVLRVIRAEAFAAPDPRVYLDTRLEVADRSTGRQWVAWISETPPMTEEGSLDWIQEVPHG